MLTEVFPWPSPPRAHLTSAAQFSSQIERLANYHATAHPPPSASATHALERHRDVLGEYRRDFARTKVRPPRAAGRRWRSGFPPN